MFKVLRHDDSDRVLTVYLAGVVPRRRSSRDACLRGLQVQPGLNLRGLQVQPTPVGKFALGGGWICDPIHDHERAGAADGSAAMGHGAPLPRNGAGDSTATTSTTSTAAAKATPKKPTAAGAHSTKTSRNATRSIRPSARADGANPARISEIQTALSRQGAYQGDPTGKWDATTVEAMRQFQTAHGLTPTGKIDALTLEKLGLGSQVSGMGAPSTIGRTTGIGRR